MNFVFLCRSNAVHSQIAARLAQIIFGDSAKIVSAGSEPNAMIHPLAIEIMQEINIDITQQKPKHINTITFSDVDFIITLCVKKVRPHIQDNAKHYHWPLPDPISPYLTKLEQLESLREVRDELNKRILNLKHTLKN